MVACMLSIPCPRRRDGHSRQGRHCAPLIPPILQTSKNKEMIISPPESAMGVVWIMEVAGLVKMMMMRRRMTLISLLKVAVLKMQIFQVVIMIMTTMTLAAEMVVQVLRVPDTRPSFLDPMELCM